MKNTSNRYYLNKSRPKHKHEYTKYKERLNMMMCICTKYDPSKNDESFSLFQQIFSNKSTVFKNVKGMFFKLCLLFISKTVSVKHQQKQCWIIYVNQVQFTSQSSTKLQIVISYVSFFFYINKINGSFSIYVILYIYHLFKQTIFLEFYY